MKTFAEIYGSMKDTPEYQIEELKLAFTESILLRMKELNNLSRTDLAARMQTTKPYVSKLLKGTNNFTFESLVKLARALECRVQPPLLIPISRHAEGILHFQPRKPIAAKPIVTEFRPRPIAAKVAATQNDDINDSPAAA